jgi:hypothetical protein
MGATDKADYFGRIARLLPLGYSARQNTNKSLFARRVFSAQFG